MFRAWFARDDFAYFPEFRENWTLLGEFPTRQEASDCIDRNNTPYATYDDEIAWIEEPAQDEVTA